MPRSSGAPVEETRPVELARVHARAAWKGEALRLALAKRAAGAAPGADLRLREADLRTRQAAVGAPWAWMLDSPPARVDDQALGNLAQCYETVARIAEGLAQLEQAEAFEPAPPVEVLRLVAEGQSMLLSALGAVGLRQDDDQRDLFQWLRERTTRHRIYVDRHMRLEDPADAGGGADLLQRFEEQHERALRLGSGRRQRVQLMNKVRYHVRKLLDGGARSEVEWQSLGGALALWKEAGLDLAERGLGELLGALGGLELPAALVDAAKSDEAARTALEALGLALGHANAGDATRADAVEDVRKLLGGRRALMVTDSEDPLARQALGEAFGVAHLEWLCLPAPREGEPEVVPSPRSERIAAALAESSPDVVFMGLRLPQAEYQAFKDRCVELHLPFVRLPGAPTPGAVAHQTMRQVGWRLRDARPAGA